MVTYDPMVMENHCKENRSGYSQFFGSGYSALSVVCWGRQWRRHMRRQRFCSAECHLAQPLKVKPGDPSFLNFYLGKSPKQMLNL
jgi:hypothetical protein